MTMKNSRGMRLCMGTNANSSSCRTIAVLNQKGGVGKTTSTVNLGAALAEARQRVCLIDLDPQAHLTLHLGIDPSTVQRTVYDLFIDPECTAADAIINARPNLDAILAEVDLAAAETELSQTADRQSILRRKFQPIASRYDFVIMDCPPSLGLLTVNAMALAQEIFVPMQAHFLALQGVGKLLETVGLVCQSINPQLRVSGIILCMHEQQTTLAKEIVSDLDSFFAEAATQNVPWSGCRVLRPAIRRNVKLAEAPSFGKTIFDYEPTCAGASDYRALAQQVMSHSPLAAALTPAPAPNPTPAPKPAPTAVIEPKPAQTAPPEPKPGQSSSRRPSPPVQPDPTPAITLATGNPAPTSNPKRAQTVDQGSESRATGSIA